MKEIEIKITVTTDDKEKEVYHTALEACGGGYTILRGLTDAILSLHKYAGIDPLDYLRYYEECAQIDRLRGSYIVHCDVDGIIKQANGGGQPD